MKIKLKGQYLLFYLAMMLFIPNVLASQSTDSPASFQERSLKPPEHPVTEDELRTFFAVCHTVTLNRTIIHEKLEAQRKQLPSWYPKPVWDEIEKAIENINLVQVGLPIYRKYLSEDDVQWLSKFLSTQRGQQLVMDFNEASIRSLHAGETPQQAHQEALAYLAHEDRSTLDHLEDQLTPSEKQDLLKHSERFNELQPTIQRITQEYGQALKEKQTEVARSIALAHQPALGSSEKELRRQRSLTSK